MAKPRDLYEILGVPRTASQDEIRKAYLKLAHKYHPDKTGGDKEAEEKLKEINGAYDILKNTEKRAQYDRFGSTDGQPFGGGGFGADFGGGGGDSPFEDLFDMLFGQGQGRRRQGSRGEPGADLEFTLKITLEEAALGAKKTIRFNRREPCGDCGGTGAAKGAQPETCRQCNGAGQVRAAHGLFSVTRTCPVCGGSGRVVTNPCRTCGGNGQVKGNRELKVDVPPGVDDGMKLRAAGEGEAGRNGGPRGDLYIQMRLEKHPIFERDGTTILCEVPVTYTQAALGASVRVPTLFGPEEIKVPAGARTGQQVSIRGKGMPDMRGYRHGDQIVVLRVETPSRLSRRQRELLEELERESDGKTYPGVEDYQHKTQEYLGKS